MESMYPISYKRDILGWTWEAIGKDLGIHRKTAKRRYEREIEAKRDTNMREFAKTLMEREPLLDFKAFAKPKIPYADVDVSRFVPMSASGNMMVTCDWHIPLHDPAMVEKLLEVARENLIKTLIIGGDYYNMDSFSHYPPHQQDAGFAVERENGLEIMRILLSWFEKIYIFWGNHDFRFARALNFKISFVESLKMLLADLGEEQLSKIQASDLDYMWIEQEKKYRFSHQKNFSKIPLTVGRQLAAKHHCSVITAHCHHFGMGVALDGENIIIEGAGLFDKHKTEYVQKTSTHHEWVQGFTMFKDGLPHLYSPVLGNI